MSKRKYKPWHHITELDQLLEQPFVYLNKTGRIIPHGWFRNWQLWYAKKAIMEWNLWASTPVCKEAKSEKCD